MSDPIETFRNEANEHLRVLESALLDLEEHPDNADNIALAFRAMHTIKGAAGMVGFDYLSRFTHHLETLFDRVRNGLLSLSNDLCHLLLKACDHIYTLLQDPAPNQSSQEYTDNLVSRISVFLDEGESAQESLAPAVASISTQVSAQAASSDEQRFEYQINVKPVFSAFTDGFDLLPLLRELKDLAIDGSFVCQTKCDSGQVPQGFNPENCYLNTTVLFSSCQAQQDIEDVFMFVADEWHINIAQHLATPEPSLLVEELFTEASEALGEEAFHSPSQAAAQVQANVPAKGQTKAQTNVPAKKSSKKAKLQNEAAASGDGSKKVAQEEAFIRVSQQKLDALMDQVGELVIMQASLDETALSREDTVLQGLSEELNRLTNNLRDIAFDIRMLPIGSAFSRFKRLVRDLSHDLNKQVKLKTYGAATELDKVVLDKLIDPLIHILRNSMDHGIEAPELRAEVGKPEIGLIKLSAWHAQGQIVIEIEDDGAGLDSTAIFNKAVERGLLAESSDLSEREIFQLIFEPGFSTAERITDVSGRGVGMDVVRSSISALQGKVLIDSEKGKGTRLSIQLPMTLSIIDGLMVSVANHKFIIPLNHVFECIELQHQEHAQDAKHEHGVIEHRDKLIPNVSLRQSFELKGQRPSIEQVVIVNTDEGLLGITVDEVDGNHQTVIRSMGRLYQDVPGVMGATILGNGGIAMILELSALAKAS